MFAAGKQIISSTNVCRKGIIYISQRRLIMKDTKERRNAKQQYFKGKLCVLYTERLYKRSYFEATRV